MEKQILLPRSVSRLPGTDFGRYRNLEYVGRGGMAVVFRAHDPMLSRDVALKFLIWDDPEFHSRFLREARAQARIKHPNVCPVYDVGEHEGIPYICMQFINGKTLKEFHDLDLRSKLGLIRAVSDALGEAHRLGVIHRDIKPGNIIVEQSKDGIWIPYLLDFGLARESNGENLTRSHAILGTPLYMSPEQMMRDENLDHRTDIYSLGVTLYELLCGIHPFDTTSEVTFIRKTLEEDPTPLRRKNASLKHDVEAVVMKCLEKEPARRYSSAEQLSQDLGRVLTGETPSAKTPSLAYKLQKRIRKHALVVGTITVSMVLIIVMGILYATERSAAETREFVAQQMGQEAQQIDSFSRQIYLRPLHDITKEHRSIEERLRNLSLEREQYGKSGRAPINYALGRGYLALHDYAKAVEFTLQAWGEGLRTSDVSYSLGRAYAGLYANEIQKIELKGSLQYQDRMRKEIEKKYRLPALQYLKSTGEMTMESPAYVEALLLYMDKQYDPALAKLDAAIQSMPWLYEAELMKGDIYRTVGGENMRQGNKTEALLNFEKARASYIKGLATGQSDPTGYTAVCRLETRAVEMQIYHTGEPPDSSFARALDYCNKALLAYPVNPEAHALKSLAYWRIAEYEQLKGRNSEPSLKLAIAAAEAALQLNPDHVEALSHMGSSHLFYGFHELEKNPTPGTHFHDAIAYLKKAVSLGKNLQSYNLLGIAYNDLADFELSTGKDPRHSYGLAIANFQEALEVDPDNRKVSSNLASCYSGIAAYELAIGIDPDMSIEKGIATLEKIAAGDLPVLFTYIHLGDFYSLRAQNKIRNGLDPLPDFDRSRSELQRARGIQADSPTILGYLVDTYLHEAHWRLDTGSSPDAALNEADKLLDQSIQLQPDDLATTMELIRCQNLRMQWLLKTNKTAAAKELKKIKTNLNRLSSVMSQETIFSAEQGVAFMLESELEKSPDKAAALRKRGKELIQDAVSKNVTLKYNYSKWLTHSS